MQLQNVMDNPTLKGKALQILSIIPDNKQKDYDLYYCGPNNLDMLVNI